MVNEMCPYYDFVFILSAQTAWKGRLETWMILEKWEHILTYEIN